MARIHIVGARHHASHRIALGPDTYGRSHLEFLISEGHVPLEFEKQYRDLVESICHLGEAQYSKTMLQRIHGDCHFGNILWVEGGATPGPFFLDFDDMVVGPPVQDLWLVVPGRDEFAIRQRALLVESYEQLKDFDRSSLRMIEFLRALRLIHFSAWIAKRWEDPIFKQFFPQFGEPRYWSEQVSTLVEQKELIEEQMGRSETSGY